MINKLASAIYNDVVAGLVGITSNPTISLEQLKDDVVDERLQIIKEYSLKNIIPRKDLLMAINCVDVDCEVIGKCPDCHDLNLSLTPEQHFEIPQLINDFAESAIEYIGATDRSQHYKVYTDTAYLYHRYLRRGCNNPYVYIETTPNKNNMYDAWVFNAPFVKTISVVGIFKDPRQLEQYSCCSSEDYDNFSFLSTEIKKRLTEKKLRYYRQFYQPPTPNNQVAK